MKVLIVNESDIDGGAARATYRMHRALIDQGIDSTMIVQRKLSDDFTVIGPETKIGKALGLIRPTMEQLFLRKYKNKSRNLFSAGILSNRQIIKKIIALNPDIVHLNWTCGGLLGIKDIRKIKKPIVWTMHDNWLFTGGCHIKYDCDKYLTHCNACPALNSQKKYDLSYAVFERKLKYFRKKNDLSIIALCSAFKEEAKKSALLEKFDIYQVPNTINTDSFYHIDTTIARKMLGISTRKKIVLFGAMNPLIDDNKGSVLLCAALKKIHHADVELLVIGSSEPRDKALPFPSQYLGKLNDDVALSLAYNAADVVVVPSKQENLSNTIMESLSCGTPVVAFNVGGNSDMVISNKNGYLATKGNVEDLARGIDEVIANGKEYYCQYASEYVKNNYSNKIVTKVIIDIYKKILNKTE